MLTDEALKELASILIEGFYKSSEIAKHGAVKRMVLDSFQKMLISNKENVEISLKRFHDWMHKNGVGVDDYRNYKQ